MASKGENVQNNSRLPFLWDYDMTEDEVKEALKEGNQTTRSWLMSRILESVRYEKVWQYFSPQEIAESFSNLRLKAPVRRAWQRALNTWGYQTP